jgi:hypothetical protein
MVVLVGLVLITATYASWDIQQYMGEILLSLWIMSINAANLVLVSLAIPDDVLTFGLAWARGIFRSYQLNSDIYFKFDRLYPFLIAVLVTVIAGILSSIVFERIPHIPDSVGYLFQAKYFSTGQLYLQAPPIEDAFALDKLFSDGEIWWNYGFPAWPAVLALGVLAGVPWLVNPVLGGLIILLTHWIICRLYNRKFAHIVIALMMVSPWFLFMSSSFMPHTISLVWVLIALVGILKGLETSNFFWGVAAS